jgi:hypothetical protein
MHPYKHCGLRCRYCITAFLAFLYFSLAATGFEPSLQPSGFTLSPLSPTCKHYPPLFSTFLLDHLLTSGEASEGQSEATQRQSEATAGQKGCARARVKRELFAP